MEVDVFEWKDDYNIGVEEIDRAHRQLFSIVNRIINNFMDSNFEKNKMICIEAIKYLKSYTLKHFAEEEAYQLAIGYGGYKTHKKIHDNMRDVVIPSLEKEIITKSYSKESLQHFVGVCAGWLAAHVLVEDQAITGKTKSRWSSTADDNSADALDRIVRKYIRELFGMNANLVNKNYAGYKMGNLFCYCDKFTVEDGTLYSAVTAVEDGMLEVAMQRVINFKDFVLDNVMLPLVTEIFKTFNQEVVMEFVQDSLLNTSSRVLQNGDFYKIFSSTYPDYSMLWRTDYGYIAFCLRKRLPQ